MHPFSTPSKHQRTLRFSGVFRGQKNGALGTNRLININNYCTHFIKLAGWHLSGVAIDLMKIFPGGNFLCANYSGGNFLGGNFPGVSFPGWELSRWEFSRYEFSWVGILRVGPIMGGNIIWWKFSGWELSGGNYPGGNFPGGNFHANHCVDVFNINFRSCETLTVANCGTILLFIETLSNFKTIKC